MTIRGLVVDGLRQHADWPRVVTSCRFPSIASGDVDLVAEVTRDTVGASQLQGRAIKTGGDTVDHHDRCLDGNAEHRGGQRIGNAHRKRFLSMGDQLATQRFIGGVEQVTQGVLRGVEQGSEALLG